MFYISMLQSAISTMLSYLGTVTGVLYYLSPSILSLPYIRYVIIGVYIGSVNRSFISMLSATVIDRMCSDYSDRVHHIIHHNYGGNSSRLVKLNYSNSGSHTDYL
jgi:hypothetical protein